MSEAVKILLVDDEPRNLDALESILATSDCSFVRAQSAEQALLAVLHHEFAAIILDIKMPGTSGVELARLIKQRKRTQHVPILFLTAHLLDERDVLEAYDVGGVDYLSKPINPAILRSKVAVFVDLFRTTRALASAVDALHKEIEERQKVQEELRLSKEQLETRVLERTAELARANREIRDNEERLRLAMAVAQVAAWEWDLSTGKLHWSTDPEIVFGFPAGAFGPDSRISHAVHPDDARVLDDAYRHAMITGAYEAEYRAVRQDGSILWIAERGRFMPDASERTRIVGVSVDLTSRKLAEEALREADRRKDEFLATLAHELRNPLAPIRYAVSAIELKAPPSPELEWAVRLIDRQTKQMARLIDDLLDVNRISRNTFELRKETVELSNIIEAAVETSRPLIEDGGHRLTIQTPDEPIWLDADFARMSQVFSNLLNNAAKFGKKDGSGGRISVLVQQNASDVSVCVRDSGIGIAVSMLPRIFDMFTQIGPSQGGLGIGLSLAKRLIELHGGAIEAHSEGAGMGSEFIVRLPTVAAPADVTRPSSDAQPSISVSGCKILIADDNPDIAESFEIMLQTLGYDVQTATNGRDALEKAERFRPTAIVLDIGMPELDGYQAAKHIREQPWGKDVILIAVTGWGQESDRRKSKEAGFDAHLVKPIDATAIVACLEPVRPRGMGGRAVC